MVNKTNFSDRPLGIIPARRSSKRFPCKNIALLAGKPLLAYAIEAARESGVFDLVCVSSEDDEILAAARAHDAGLALKRPPHLAADTVQLDQVCAYLLEYFASQGQPYPEFGLLLATSPLRTSQDIRAAYDIFTSQDADSVVSLVPFTHPPQRALWVTRGRVESYFGAQYMKQDYQSLDRLYRHDGSVIFAKSKVFLKEKTFFGPKTAPYFIPEERSVDIDNPLDLAWAEFLLDRLRPCQTEGDVEQ
jgi:pseudaminic acid cytidylyltransferase